MNRAVTSSIYVASSVYKGFEWMCNTPSFFCKSWFCTMELMTVRSDPWCLGVGRSLFCKALTPSATLAVKALHEITSAALLTCGISDCHLLEVNSLLTRINIDFVLGNRIFSSVLHWKEY